METKKIGTVITSLIVILLLFTMSENIVMAEDIVKINTNEDYEIHAVDGNYIYCVGNKVNRYEYSVYIYC